VVLGKDSLIEANEAELDPGHRVRGCAAHAQDPKPSRHDAVTAPVVDDLPTSAGRVDLEPSCVPPPVPGERARLCPVFCAAGGQQDGKNREQDGDPMSVHRAHLLPIGELPVERRLGQRPGMSPEGWQSDLSFLRSDPAADEACRVRRRSGRLPL